MKKARLINGNIDIIDWDDKQRQWIPEEEQSLWAEFIPALQPEYDEEIERVKISYIESEGNIYEKLNIITDGDKVRRLIQSLKDELAATDYKVIKMYEAKLLMEQLPYDEEELRSRQAVRDRINELEKLL